MTDNKLADAVTIYKGEAQTLARVRDGGSYAPLFTHPQPPPAPVQPSCSLGCTTSCRAEAHGAPSECQSLKTREAIHAPQPATAADNNHAALDGAGELPPLPNPWQCETRICPALFTGEQVRNYVIAAIAALRQPVAVAVRELPGKWRKNATELGRSSDPKGIWNDTLLACATELESALTSQQESRNGSEGGKG